MFPVYELLWFSKCQWQGGPLVAEKVESSLQKVMGVIGIFVYGHSSPLKSCYRSTLAASTEWRLACRVCSLKFPSSMDSLNVNWRTWVEALTRRKERWGRKPCAFWDHPTPFATADCQWQHLLGSGPPTKERTLRKKITGEPGGGGRQGHTEQGQSWDGIVCGANVWKLTTVWLSNMLLYQHCWALKS